MAADVYQEFCRRLRRHVPAERVHSDPLSTLAYGTDASCYRITPRVVVRTQGEGEVKAVLAEASALGLAVTFRAAGTSLSGQALSDSILLVASYGWESLEVLEDGAAIRMQPGVKGGDANAALAPYGRKIGPDPATLAVAMLGGIIANNSSGMCCGVAQNSYHTLRSLRLVLADGSVLDTGDARSVAAFRSTHAPLLLGLVELSVALQADEELAERVRRKYRMKNTTGYGLNALLDFDDPVDMLVHLVVGSEGTLAFISEVTLNTVPEHPHKASALLCYPDIASACQTVQRLAQHKDKVAAAELMDRASLRSVQSKPGVPPYLAGLPDAAAALLVETRAADGATLAANVAAIGALAGDTLHGAAFSSDAAECERLWKVRKGMFPSVGAMREPGTTVIIEDVAFPIDCLAEGTIRLQALFHQHGYHEAIIFGHALEGNLHFVFTPNLGEEGAAERYDAFIEDVCRLVALDYDGALKAEHGTGRNMAPFVELEWGPDAYTLMRQIKALFDPQGLLNPDVILTRSPALHLQHLKPIPPTSPLVDACIECGFCESQCPSRALTLTPRQRIVANRELSRLDAAGDSAGRAVLEAAYRYPGDDTCTACGLCQTACPVEINTGLLTLQRRAAALSPRGRRGARLAALHYGLALRGARQGLRVLGWLRRWLGGQTVSQGVQRLRGVHLTPQFPRAAPALPCPPAGTGERVVYLPSCLSRTLAPSPDLPDARPLAEVVASVLGKAGYTLVYPQRLDGLCCGTPFRSKGAPDVADAKLAELRAALVAASDGGRWPVLVDNGVCSAALIDGLAGSGLRVYEVASFVEEVAADRLRWTQQDEEVALHVVCSMRTHGQGPALAALARRCARRVVEPRDVTCCGFAGDKGFTLPELNASALCRLAEQVHGCHAGYSTSCTCEIGLTEHAGIPYQHLIYLVDRATQPNTR